MNKLAVIIPTFNRKKQLSDLLNCLQEQTYKLFEAVIVVDGSTDGTIEMINDNFPHFHIVKGNGNWWWTKSINEGIKKAYNIGCTKFLLINDDTYFKDNFLETFTNAYKEHKGVMGAISISAEDPHSIFYSGIYKKNWLTCKQHEYYKGTPYNESINGVHPAQFLGGRGMLFNIEVLDKLGFFDEENFPQYMADFDFSYMAYKNGFPVNMCWDSPIYSYINMTAQGSTNSTKTNYLSLYKSLFNDKSPQSLLRCYNYYKKHAKYIWPLSLCFHYGRVFLSLTKKTHNTNS